MAKAKTPSAKSQDKVPAKTERKSADSNSTGDRDFVILESGYGYIASPSIDPKEIGKTVHLRRR